MKALGLFIFCLIICSTQLHSQPVLWAKQAISDGPIEGYDLVTDNAGIVYVAGDHTDPVSFDNVVIDNDGWGTMFVAKYDLDGQALWSRSIRGTSSNQLRCMTFGNDAIYVSGYYYQTNDLTILDFGDKALGNHSSRRMILMGHISVSFHFPFPKPMEENASQLKWSWIRVVN